MRQLLRTLDNAAERLLFDVLFAPRHRRKTLAVMTLLAGLVMGWHQASVPAPLPAPTESEPADNKLLIGRPWLDKQPKDYKDAFSLYIFGDEEIDDGLFGGVVVKGIPVKYVVEFFGYRPRGGIQFWFPADDSKPKTNFKVTREKNGKFDLKLQLEADPRHGGKPHTYWGRVDGDVTALGLPLPEEARKLLKK